VTLSWLTACVLGAIPFLLSPQGTETWIDAVFESVSGFTTTGASVLSQLEQRPRSLLLWRSITQWIGGMGMVLIGVAVLPVLGIGGMQLYKAEAPGPTKDKIAPRISETAKILWVLYLGLTALGVLVFWLEGMPLFDAVCHAMSAISTGGFSTHDASLGHTSSRLTHWTVTALMLLGGTSFAVLHRTLTRGLPWAENVELRAYVVIFVLAALVITIDLRLGMPEVYASNLDALEHASFQAASILTTTGFTTTDYDLWPSASHAALFLLFFMGGMAGSTAGGVKVIRVVLWLRQSLSQFFQLVHPRGVASMKLGKHLVEPAVLQSVGSFIALWTALLGLGTLLFSFFGMDLLTGFATSITTLGNVGPGFAGIGPSNTFAFLEPGAKLVAALWMILGRLEIYTVLVILTPGFWRL
jgi:trk system potassium uptake protein TrkH